MAYEMKKGVVESKVKNPGYRNWLLTQWIPALERGGAPFKFNPKKKESAFIQQWEWFDTLDPQSLEWYEKQLEKLAAQEWVAYIVYQGEDPSLQFEDGIIPEGEECEARHIGAFIVTKTTVRMTQIKQHLHRTTWLGGKNVYSMKKKEAAQHYCMKGACGIPNCAHTWERHGDKQCHEFAKEVWLAPKEFGVWHSSNSRVDLEYMRQRIDELDTWRQVIRDPEIAREVAKYQRYAKAYFNTKPKNVEAPEKWRPWQQELLDELAEEADDRKIIWYYDEIGAAGKSVMAKHLYANHGAFVASSSKKNDIIEAYDGESIICFDFSRGDRYAGYETYIAMEDLKNGLAFSPKYHSQTKVREGNAHIVVFSNHYPDIESLTYDRWDIRHLNKLDVIQKVSFSKLGEMIVDHPAHAANPSTTDAPTGPVHSSKPKDIFSFNL